MMSVTNNALGQARFKAFQQGLEKLGWTDSRNVALEVRWSEERIKRYAEITSEFVRLGMDVIVTTATPPTVLTREATQVIPIVFVGAGDPVAAGLVASLARPGGTLTGFTNFNNELEAKKRFEILTEVVPDLATSVSWPRGTLLVGEFESRSYGSLTLASGVWVGPRLTPSGPRLYSISRRALQQRGWSLGRIFAVKPRAFSASAAVPPTCHLTEHTRPSDNV